ncbi:ribonuclease BN, partial [filamentous cyanobacterium CCP5]
MSPKQVWRLLKEAVQEWNRDKASRLAAALAYYTVFSLSPLLVLVLAIASLFFEQSAAREQIITQAQGLMGQEGAEFIQSALEGSSQPGSNSGLIATVISVVLLLVGASGVFAQLQDALNTIWNVEPRPEEGFMAIVRKRLLSFGMIVVIGFLLLVSLVVSALIAGFSQNLNQSLPGMETVVQVVNFMLSFAITT